MGLSMKVNGVNTAVVDLLKKGSCVEQAVLDL